MDIPIQAASLCRKDRWNPRTSTSKGPPSGARLTKRISVPGKRPISISRSRCPSCPEKLATTPFWPGSMSFKCTTSSILLQHSSTLSTRQLLIETGSHFRPESGLSLQPICCIPPPVRRRIKKIQHIYSKQLNFSRRHLSPRLDQNHFSAILKKNQQIQLTKHPIRCNLMQE